MEFVLRRSHFVVLACLLFFSGCATLHLFVGGSDRGSYFPLAVGDEWEYRLVTTAERGTRSDTTTIATYEHRIIGTTRLADGKPAYVRVWISEVTLRDTLLPDSSFSQTETTYLRRSASAVYRYVNRQSRPDSILLLPPRIDQRWTSEGVSFWVAAREDLQIVDQSYPDCWRIKSGPVDDPVPSLTWFARGYGLVRLLSDRTVAGKHLRTDYYVTDAKIR